jgi:hypothetical protein
LATPHGLWCLIPAPHDTAQRPSLLQIRLSGLPHFALVMRLGHAQNVLAF